MSITESDVKQKFDEWFEREYKHLESSKYTDAVPHIKYGFWMAYRAAVAEFLGKSENFMNIISELQGSLVVSDFKEACKYGKEIKELKSRNDTLVEALEKAQHTITEMDNRIRQQNRNVCELFDDGKALRERIAELESRTVTVKMPQRYDLTGETDGNCCLNDAEMVADNEGVYLLVRDVKDMLAAAGIKVEAE